MVKSGGSLAAEAETSLSHEEIHAGESVVKTINSTCTAALVAALMLTIGCQNVQQKTEAQTASGASHHEPLEQTASRPTFVEGHPDKRRMVTTAIVTKVRSVNDLDARVRLAVVRWVKSSTGETVSNVIVCQADRHDCERLDVGGSYTMAWLPRGATYDVYGLQGYQTVLLSTGSYAAWLRGDKKNSGQDEGIITPYAVMDLSKGKANNLREWATE